MSSGPGWRSPAEPGFVPSGFVPSGFVPSGFFLSGYQSLKTSLPP